MCYNVLMQKQLVELLGALTREGMQYEMLDGYAQDAAVTSLVFDSRQVRPGALFFALPGTHTDGSRFIRDAISNGAAAVVYQGDSHPFLQSGQECDKEVSCVRVTDTRAAMAPIADCFFDEPSRRLIVIGVTGTEGKSSTVSFIWQLLRLTGEKAGFISTVQYSTGGEALDNPEHQTTPEAPIVQEKLHLMAEAGCHYAVIESSSHALSKRTNRLGCVRFDCAVFMNVTLEHLEFHGTFEQYRDDKANLFRMLDRHDHKKIIAGNSVTVPCVGIVNAMDKSAAYFKNATKHKVLSFGADTTATLVARDVHSSESDVTFEAGGMTVKAFTPGAFNALNIMAASLAVESMTGKALSMIFAQCVHLVPVKGRMEHVNALQPFEIIIDYAHTPSSFEMLLPPIKKRCKGCLVAVFGSGGERDKVKRPLQGEIAAKYCDKIILANEDPRGEDEMAILKEIASGVLGRKADNGETSTTFTIGENLLLIPDRKKAIKAAFSGAMAGDIVLLLGKGHENSIIGKDGPVPYDEETAAREVLSSL